MGDLLKDFSDNSENVPSITDGDHQKKTTPVIVAPKDAPVITGGLDYNQSKPIKKENQFRKLDLDNFTKEEFDNKFDQTYITDDYKKKLAENQSNWDRTANLVGRVVGNVLGGTLQSVGAVGAIGEGIIDEVKGQDADFDNSLMEFGRTIEEYGKNLMPNYRSNPGQSWDVKDPAWWFEGVENAFSALQFLAGGYAAAKVVGGGAKLIKAEQALAKMGANVEKIKYATKVGTGAVFSRNAENLMESYQVRQDVKDNLNKEWLKDPSKFEELKNSEVAKELEAEGREVNAENLSNFIAGKAGWKSYFINSANIVFDALQIAPLFKGFSAETRIGKFNTPTNVLEAQNKVLGSSAKSITKFNKIGDYLNPVIGGLGRSSSEGIEEAINYVGSEEGKNLAQQLTNKDDSSFGTRMKNYLKSGDLYESAFWGALGGGVYEGATKIAGKALDGVKGSNTGIDFRVAEIANRSSIIEEASKEIKNVINAKDLDDNNKKELLGRIKSELAMDLGVRAAQAGNVNLLIDQIKSPDYAKKLVEMGIAEHGDVEKAVAKTIDDVKLAEGLYKQYYNSFYLASNNDYVKNSLINESVTLDFLKEKNKQRVNNIANTITDLKSKDAYITSTKDENVDSTIQLRALETAKSALEDFINKSGNTKDAILTDKGKEVLAKLEEDITKSKELIKDSQASLTGINPNIISKQAEIIFAEGVNNINGQRIANLRSKAHIEKQEGKFEEAKNKAVEEDLKSFKDKLDTELKENKHTSNTLESLKKQVSKDKSKVSYVNEKLKAIKVSEEKTQRTQDVQEQTKKPVIVVDESKLNPVFKKDIDALSSSKDIDALEYYASDDFASSQPMEAQYAKNKLAELNGTNKEIQETIENNAPVETGVAKEFEISEEAQQDISSSSNTTIQNLTGEEESKEEDKKDDGINFLRRIQGEPSTRIYIPLFDTHLPSYKSHKYFDIANGNIKVNKEHEETVKTLFSGDLKEDVEVEISIDKKNPYYNANKDKKDSVPIKFSYKGITIGYLATESGLRKAIDKMIEDTTERGGEISDKISELELELVEIQKIRNTINLSDTVYKSTLVYKSNGTVISRGKDKKTALRSVKGIFDSFYAIEPGSVLDNNKVINLEDKSDFFYGASELRDGIIYGKLKTANEPFPVPLFVSRLSKTDASKVQKHIDKLLDLLNEGLTSEHQAVKEVKDKIADYIKVDRSTQFDKPVGFRVHPKDKKGNEPRIEMAYYNSKKERLVAVIKKNSTTQADYVQIFNSEKKLIHNTTLLEEDFNEVLQRKYYNIDYSKFKDPKYKERLIEEEIVRTDVAQVLDSKGNVISNTFGFNNDFSVEISSNIYTGEKPKESDTPNRLLRISAYEPELKYKASTENELKYRENYTVFHKPTNAKETLKEILKNPQNENIKEIAEWLLKRIDKNNVALSLDNSKSGSYYRIDDDHNHVYIKTNDRPSETYFQYVTLHELVHALTVYPIYNTISFRDRKTSEEIDDFKNIVFKDNTPSYIKEFVYNIDAIRNDISYKLAKKHNKPVSELIKNTDTFYGLEDVNEFIAEVMTNPNFRNEIRNVSDKSLIDRIYNAIVEFLNKYLGTNLTYKESKDVKKALNTIKNFIDKNENFSYSGREVGVSGYIFERRITDAFDNRFSREEIHEVTNTFKGNILNIVRSKKVNIDKEDSVENESSVRDAVRTAIRDYKSEAPDGVKNKVELVDEYFHNFYEQAVKEINKNFKITSAYDIEDINDNQEITKTWEDTAAKQVSSQDTITRQIKMFVMTTPKLDSTKVTFTEKEDPIWDNKQSTVTGMNQYLDFNVVYPYMVRNLIGTRTPNEIIERLKRMSGVHPEFAYMAYELGKDANLLAQIHSNMGRKYQYDSYVTFLSNYDNGLIIRVANEAKDTRYDILLANQWNNNINIIIDGLDTPQKEEALRHEVSKLNFDLIKLGENIDKNKEAIIEKTFELANTIGINLSHGAIQADLDNARSWDDFSTISTLKSIYNYSISKKKKSNAYGNLNTLAERESIFAYDIVENSVLSIDGKPLYTVRNPHFLSNWFDLCHAKTPEAKQEFETLLKDYAKVPDLQLSNWLWNESNKPGFLNYKIEDNKRVATTVNWEFANKFSFHNYAGAKETVYKNAQDYTEFSETDWMMVNILNHIQGSKKQDYIQVPVLIPSDSGTMYTLEIKKIALGKDDWHQDKINKKSLLFQAVRNTVRQEIRRIQQATEQVFDIVDNKLVPKTDLDTRILQQYGHYGKEFIYNADGSINLNDTLLNKDGSPKGKHFQFQNISVKRGDKVVTLNDIDGIFTNHHLQAGEVSSNVISNIDSFIDEFIKQQVEACKKSYKPLEATIKDKHDNIGDGSFEDLMVEYVLNQYIANVEQFNLFNGVISEYKDRLDTNKRAKQMFAPGTGLSTEAMKMQLQNGSWQDGATFSAITIKDIKLKSNTYDLIEENLSKTIKNKEELESILKPYREINAGDAQGYITLDRYEQIIRGLGKWNLEYERIFTSIRKGEQVKSSDLKTLQPIKGFYYGREYDATLNRFVSTQIKYSTIPLIPQLVTNTELEKLMKYMNKQGIQEAFYESAHKIGAKTIYKINEGETISDILLAKTEPTTYLNKNWQLQLEVPEHLIDEQNLLATQISKLIVANIYDTTNYTVDGISMTGREIKDHYNDVLSTNINESAQKLLDDLGVIVTEQGFKVKNETIRETLIKEVEKRGLSENYNFAIELDSNGDFKLPLFANNMTNKWEAILTSLFTNRIIKQKMPGASAVLASRLFLDSKVEFKDYKTKGVEWIKEKEDNRELKLDFNEDGVPVIEVLLGAWSKKLYKEGTRISIDELPEEIRTMTGYRIPTETKRSAMIFKVVGFLPEESKGLIVTPDDIVVKMGSDFDIDKVFIMTKNFRKIGDTFENIKYIDTSKLDDKALRKHYNEISGKNVLKGIEKKLKTLEYTVKDEEVKKLVDDIYDNYTDFESDDLVSDDEILKNRYDAYWKVKEKVEAFISFEEFKKLSVAEQNNLKARQNRIIEIYQSILTNPAHLLEILSPAEFNAFKELKTEIQKVYGESDDNINPLTEEGQRAFRKRNMAGRALKGIAANLNAFGAIAQETKMQLNNKIAFRFKFDLSKYSKATLKERYKDDVTFDKDFAYVVFKSLGYAPDGTYLNIDDQLILEHASQGIGAAVDIVKDPTFDSFNATTYTYPVFHTMLLSGIPTRLAGMFIRQPIIKRLNDYYFDNISLLSRGSKGNQIEIIKRYYQTLLASEMIKKGQTFDTDVSRVFTRRKKDKVSVNSLDKKYLVYLQRKETKVALGYDPDELTIFSVEELKGNLEQHAKGYEKLTQDERIEFLRTQLQVLEYFNSFKKAGEGVQDVLKVTKVDGLGAGPSMMVTNELVKEIDRLGDSGNDSAHRVLINGEPAIRSIYPTHFDLDNKSVYPVLETYLNMGNKLSLEVLQGLFIQQSSSYRNVISDVNNNLGNTIKDNELKNLYKFLNTNLLTSFNKFSDLDVNKVLGIKQDINNSDDITFDNFQKLSVANKVAYLQKKDADYLKTDTQHVLNFLTALLQKNQIEENGYHKLEFVFYKNEFTDDNLSDSIMKMSESENEYHKDLANDLINYAYVTSGLTFGLNSFAKIVPNEVLYNWGLGQYLYDAKVNADKGLLFAEEGIVDKFIRNNWNNTSIVPIVSTRYQYEEAEADDGRIVNRIKIDEDEEKVTIDNTPDWSTEDGVISVPQKRWKELPTNIKNAPYILVTTKDTRKLYKRYTYQREEEMSTDIEGETELTFVTYNTVGESVMYYEVSKLGKDGILEFTDNSIFDSNKASVETNQSLSQLENVVNKIEENKVNENLILKNNSQKKIDEQNDKCNG